jgi:hypothetical protein
MELLTPALLNGLGVVGVVLLVGLLIFRGLLIPVGWHRDALNAASKQIDKAEARADRWEAVALRALDATERLTEPVEIAAKVMTRLPVVTDEVP